MTITVLSPVDFAVGGYVDQTVVVLRYVVCTCVCVCVCVCVCMYVNDS